MTMEYRVRFENGEWVITQRLDPAGSGAVPVAADGQSVTLPASYDECVNCASELGGLGEDETGPGGSVATPGFPGRIVLFGPLVISGGPCGADLLGGLGEDPTDPGEA